MRDSRNGLTADEINVYTHASTVARSACANGSQTWRLWGGAVFALVLLIAFAQTLWSLIVYSASSELYSYTLLIPFVSGYLLYTRRSKLPKDYTTDLTLAILSLAAGVGILLLTYSWKFTPQALAHGQRIPFLTLSFVCCAAAGGFFFLGRAWMQAAAFPLAYLIFMVPLPGSMTDALEQASSTASAEMANLLFHLSGIPFFRAGQIFQLPNITLEVAQECSGIRSSLVLFITSILAANLFLRTTWRRFALVAIVIPLGILRNGFRIFVIGVLCVQLGPQMIDSLIHRRGGPLFFVLSLIPFLVMLWLLRKNDEQTRRSK